MAETTTTEQQPANVSKEISGVGHRQKFSFTTAQNDDNNVVINEEEQPAIVTAEVAPTTTTTEVVKETIPTSEQLKAYFASQNIEFDGDLDALKERLKPKAAEPTEEEKLAAQRAEEKEMLDVYLGVGGTIEEFGAIKQIANSDVVELSKTAAIKELTDAGFTKDEAETEVKKRYYQIELDSLERDEEKDETEEEFQKRKADIQKKIDFGTKKLANKSLHIKQDAERTLNELKRVIKEQKLQKQQEEQFSSKVDEHFKTLPRKLTFDIGELNGKQLNPIQYELDEADINEVKALLKDTQKRKQFFFNQDGSPNLENIASVMLRDKALKSAVKVSLLEGMHRNTQEFEKVFPNRTAYQAGIGAASIKNNGAKSEIVAAGQRQTVRRPQPQK